MNAPPHAHDAHDAEHEEMLHAHLAGDLAPDDPRLVERLGRCRACRERLDELRALTTLLERVGGEQRAHLAPTAGPAPGADRVAATLHALAQGRAPAALRPVPAPSRRATLWRVGLAAASVLAAGWIVKSLLPEGSEPREDVLLGDRGSSRVHPSGPVERFDRFDWDDPPPNAAYYRFQAWKQGEELEADPIVEGRVSSLPWTPDPEELERLDSLNAIHWELIAVDAEGTPIDRCSGDAQLSERH